MQAGDVEKTWADVSELNNDYGYCSNVGIDKGIGNFIAWYKSIYVNINK